MEKEEKPFSEKKSKLKGIWKRNRKLTQEWFEFKIQKAILTNR